MVAAFALGCDSPILFEHSPDALYLWLADSGTANSFFLRTCSEGFAFQQCITDLESLDSNLIFSLTDGGTAGIFWGFTVTVIASIFIYLSIGEMASMSPTAGGQYHWVSEYAPPWCQKYLSYITGKYPLMFCLHVCT